MSFVAASAAGVEVYGLTCCVVLFVQERGAER